MTAPLVPAGVHCCARSGGMSISMPAKFDGKALERVAGSLGLAVDILGGESR